MAFNFLIVLLSFANNHLSTFLLSHFFLFISLRYLIAFSILFFTILLFFLSFIIHSFLVLNIQPVPELPPHGKQACTDM
jgi:hypothetical protein